MEVATRAAQAAASGQGSNPCAPATAPPVSCAAAGLPRRGRPWRRRRAQCRPREGQPPPCPRHGATGLPRRRRQSPAPLPAMEAATSVAHARRGEDSAAPGILLIHRIAFCSEAFILRLWVLQQRGDEVVHDPISEGITIHRRAICR
ncbi:hypothetical protein ACP4OV_005151 [Aristida adscensionis]